MDKILFLFLDYLDFICTNTIAYKIHTRNVEKQPKTWYERLKTWKMPMFFGNAKNTYLHIL